MFEFRFTSCTGFSATAGVPVKKEATDESDRRYKTNKRKSLRDLQGKIRCTCCRSWANAAR